MLPTDGKIFTVTKTPTWDLELFWMITHFEAVFFVGNNASNRKQDFPRHRNFLLPGITHFLGKAVLSKTVNCSSVNLVNAVLSDLANTLDWILNIGTDFERLDTFGTPQVLSYGNLPWHLLSCVLTRPGWWSWGTRLNRGDKKSLYLWHARAWGASL